MTPELPPDVPLFDEDGALSREFLLHRGTCCGNGCRNCPYGFRQPSVAEPGEVSPPGSGAEKLPSSSSTTSSSSMLDSDAREG